MKLHVYQAWFNKEEAAFATSSKYKGEGTILLAESNSYNSLADQLKISVGTVRNNMNWYKGINITNDKGGKTLLYI